MLRVAVAAALGLSVLALIAVFERGRVPGAAGVKVASEGPRESWIEERAPVFPSGLPTDGKGGPRPDKPGEAMEYYLQQRGGPIDYQYLSSVAASLRSQSRAVGDIATWEALGPGNIGGRTRALLIDPVTPGTMYAAGVAGGTWKSTDGGASWSALDDLMANLAVVTMVFAGQGSGLVDTSTLYAGTGEGFFNADSVRGAGVFKSTDAGASWTQLSATNNEDFYYVNKLVASPNNNSVLYAATRTGVWKTSDAGTNWAQVLSTTGFGGTNDTLAAVFGGILDIAIRTDLGTDTLFASSGSFTVDGVYRSLDAGATWSRVLVDTDMARTSLAIAPSDQNIIYAAAAEVFFDVWSLYRSADGGTTWATIQGTVSSPNIFREQGWYDNVIAVSPTDPSEIYIGAIAMYRSSDSGATFTQFGAGHADQHAIVFHPNWNGSTNQRMFVGNDGGIYETTNASSGSPPTWTTLNNGYQVTQFYHGRPLPAGFDGYLGGTQDNGTIMSTDADGPNGWWSVGTGDGVYVSYDPADPGTIFFGWQNLALWRRTSGMLMNMMNGSVTGFVLFINPHCIDPSDGEIIWYGTTDGPWRTTNASSAISTADVNWIDAGMPFTSPPTAWAVAPNDSNKVYVGAGSSLYRNFSALSATAGTTWTRVDGNGLLAGGRSWLEIDANDPTGDTVYVTSSTLGEFVSPHVNRTTDAGDTWTDITSNLPAIPFHSIVVQPGVPQNLFLGSELGVFLSRDTGASWVHMDTPGFANTVVEALEFQDDNTLYAFTHGRGAFRAIISPDDDDMTVAPMKAFEMSGPEGGAFSPSSRTYTLRNTGASSFDWSASDNLFWLSLSPTSGTLAAGASTTVTATLGVGANVLSTGLHEGSMTFRNVSSGFSIERGVQITVTGQSQTIRFFPLGANPGWPKDGAWAYGVPLGLGSHGGDPTSGKTGSFVYGYNLSGNYGDDIPERSLTTTAIDCSGYVGVSLNFWRWLSVEDASRDRVRIQASNDGSVWHDLWVNTQAIIDDAQWIEQTFDISTIADNQPAVYIRWSIGPTDATKTRPGWNIDDVTISGTVPADEVWVDFAYIGVEVGTPAQPFNTLTEAVAVLSGDGTETVKVKAYTGDTESAESITLNKKATIESVGGSVRVGAVP